MNTIREIQQINERELELGIAGTSASWHEKYKHSPWIYIGNLDHNLTEGDIICVLSQYGEIEDFHLVRNDDTDGQSKGFAFCKYEDTKSTILAVDNLCGITLCGRSLRIDHVENYRLPKHLLEKEQEQQKEGRNDIPIERTAPGHAYRNKELASEYTLEKGIDLFARPPKRKEIMCCNINSENLSDDDDDDDDNEDNDRNSKTAKRRRKEERRLKREAKELKRKEHEKKRMKHEEKRRERRARKMSSTKSSTNKRQKDIDRGYNKESNDESSDDYDDKRRREKSDDDDNRKIHNNKHKKKKSRRSD